jgi:thioredoxin reductase
MERHVDPMSITGKVAQAEERFPIVVIGAGPAGCAAATEAAGHGLPVLLVDEHPVEPGLIGLDVPYHFGQRADGSVRNRGRMLERVVETNPALAEAFEQGVEIRLGTAVWGAFVNGPTVGCLPEPLLGLSDGDRSWLVGYRRLIVATGRRDLGLAFPGWERPGVMGITALHALVERYGAFAGRRIVMLGSGAEALAAVLAALKAGLEVAAVVEVAPAPLGPHDLLSAVAEAWVPLLTSTVIAGTDGAADGVEAVRLQRLDARGVPVPGAERTIACDTVCLGVGAVPNVEILDLLGCRLAYRPELGGHVPVTDEALRTSLPDVHAAGDCTGVTPAKSRDPGLAAAEGRLAGTQAAASLGAAPRAASAPPPPDKARHVGAGAPLGAWIRAVQAATPEDLVICQCEGVTRGDLTGVRPPRYLGAASPGIAGRSIATLLVGGPGQAAHPGRHGRLPGTAVPRAGRRAPGASRPRPARRPAHADVPAAAPPAAALRAAGRARTGGHARAVAPLVRDREPMDAAVGTEACRRVRRSAGRAG